MTPRITTINCARCDSPPGTTDGCESCEAYAAALRDRDRACYAWHMYPVGPMPPGFREWLTRHNGVKRG